MESPTVTTESGVIETLVNRDPHSNQTIFLLDPIAIKSKPVEVDCMTRIGYMQVPRPHPHLPHCQHRQHLDLRNQPYLNSHHVLKSRIPSLVQPHC